LSGFPLIKKFLRINVIWVEVADPSRPLEDTDFRSSKKVDRSGEQAHFRSFLEKNLEPKIPV